MVEVGFEPVPIINLLEFLTWLIIYRILLFIDEDIVSFYIFAEKLRLNFNIPIKYLILT